MSPSFLILLGIVLVAGCCALIWRYARRLEREIEEERRMREQIEFFRQYDPQQAMLWQFQYDQKYGGK